MNLKHYAYLVGLFALIILPQTSWAASYPDVPDSHKNSLAIQYLTRSGTLQGYPDGTFRPDSEVNRAELMKILVESQGLSSEITGLKNCFPDVKSEWYAPYVCYAAKQKWVQGYPDGYFRPGTTVNKVEAVKMVIGAMGLQEKLPERVNEHLYDDVQNASWYAPYLAVAHAMNTLEETGDNFYPTNGMTRASVAEMIFRTVAVMETGAEPFSDDVRNDFIVNGEVPGLVIKMDMTAKNYSFEPEAIWAAPNRIIQIHFSEVDGSHTFTMDELGINETLEEGMTITFAAPSKTGEYQFYCKTEGHQEAGMRGRLLVVEETEN